MAKKKEEPAKQAEAAETTAARTEPEAQPEQPAEDQSAALEKELAAAKVAHIRTLAEYDNYRKRSTREKEAAYGDAKAAALKELLPVLDNFERALSAPDTDAESLKKGMEIAFREDNKVVLEEFINGFEVECAVLGNEEPAASTVGEILPCNEFYDYEAKYINGDTGLAIPAKNISEEKMDEVRATAVRAYNSLGCAGLSRVDFFVDKETGEVYFNEINTLPGFTSISMYPKLWEASGVCYADLLDKLIELALERGGKI